jgi:integrase
MGYIRKRGKSYRAEVYVNGIRESRSFNTHAHAKAWKTARELALSNNPIQASQKPLSAALSRYADEVSPSKKGARWEAVRLSKLSRDPIASIPLRDLSATDVAAWRDRALRSIKPASVAREFTLLRSVLEIARKEWRWIASNPTQDVKKPSGSPPRKRRVSDEEAWRLCMALGYDEGPPENVSQRVALAFLFAIETGMRAGEICTFQRLTNKTVTLAKTKNTDAREVPLSPRAREILDLVGDDFNLKPPQIDALFRKAKKRAGVVGMTFHDSRAEACTRLARKLDVLDLARMIGHRDPRSLLIYYRETAAMIADKLA